MEKYKETLRTRMNGLSLIAACAAVIYIGLTFYRDRLPVLPSFIKGFHTGAFIGIELIVAAYLGKYLRARKDEQVLKKMFIEETDERTSLILHKASTLGMIVIFGGLALATMVAGFFNTVAFFTLMGALVFALVVFYVLWVYFAKKL